MRRMTRPAEERRAAWTALRAEIAMLRAIERERMLRSMPTTGSDASEGAT